MNKKKTSRAIEYITTSKTRFCHYTSLECARKILSSGTFYLSKYSTMNDLAESLIHKEDVNRVFVLSLTHSEALNIPVFYLYGGIDGKGCRIQLTEAKVREMIQNADVHYVNKQFKCLKKSVPKKSYKVLYDWVYYVAQNGYSEHGDSKRTYEGLESALKELSTIDRHWFVKSPVWKYEKEFRIVVKFKQDIPYDHIALSFSRHKDDHAISVLLGPEFEKEKLEETKKEFATYGVSKTDLAYPDRIAMNLVERNKNLLK